MIRFLVAASLLLMLGACGASLPVAGKPAPAGPPPPPMPDEGIACAADVRLCSDGSYVSRNPAKNCTFDLCPGERNQ